MGEKLTLPNLPIQNCQRKVDIMLIYVDTVAVASFFWKDICFLGGGG